MISFTKSLTADPAQTLDFYIGLIGATGTLTTATGFASGPFDSTILVNSFVMPLAQMTNMKVAISNFWTDGAGTASITGN